MHCCFSGIRSACSGRTTCDNNSRRRLSAAETPWSLDTCGFGLNGQSAFCLFTPVNRTKTGVKNQDEGSHTTQFCHCTLLLSSLCQSVKFSAWLHQLSVAFTLLWRNGYIKWPGWLNVWLKQCWFVQYLFIFATYSTVAVIRMKAWVILMLSVRVYMCGGGAVGSSPQEEQCEMWCWWRLLYQLSLLQGPSSSTSRVINKIQTFSSLKQMW